MGEEVHYTTLPAIASPANACGADWMATTSSPTPAEVTCPCCLRWLEEHPF